MLSPVYTSTGNGFLFTNILSVFSSSIPVNNILVFVCFYVWKGLLKLRLCLWECRKFVCVCFHFRHDVSLWQQYADVPTLVVWRAKTKKLFSFANVPHAAGLAEETCMKKQQRWAGMDQSRVEWGLNSHMNRESRLGGLRIELFSLDVIFLHSFGVLLTG